MYGRENRLKVAEDEAKHAAEQEEALARHQAAEAAYRHRMLLAQARRRQGVSGVCWGGTQWLWGSCSCFPVRWCCQQLIPSMTISRTAADGTDAVCGSR